MAFLLAIVISATFTFIDLVPEALGLKAIPAFEVLSFNYHFKSIARGVLDLRDIVFFVSIIIGAVMLTTWSLESRKWKGA